MGPEKLAILTIQRILSAITQTKYRTSFALHETLHQVTISSDEIKKYETDAKK